MAIRVSAPPRLLRLCVSFLLYFQRYGFQYENMEHYWDDFDIEEVHFRDKWQFELKSHYTPSSKETTHLYNQELYLYVPATLQINQESYPKEQFYQDQTNLIRYKTPESTLQQMIDPDQTSSPLNKIKNHLNSSQNGEKDALIERELKLLGTMVKSTLRNDINRLIQALRPLPENQISHFEQPLTTLLIHFDILLKEFSALEPRLKDYQLKQTHLYVADFINVSSNYYFTALLAHMRKEHPHQFPVLEDKICNLLIMEKKWREEHLEEPEHLGSNTENNETILYQIGLLNKFVGSALLLNVSIDPIEQRYRNVIAGIAASIAMTIYILLFVWQGTVFVINSEPFIIFTIFIYVLKDRIKDEIKNLSMKQAFRWFSDYKTEIRTPNNKTVIGELRESFSFLDPSRIPEDVEKSRNMEHHKTLQLIQRQEHVIYYKKTVKLHSVPELQQSRFPGLIVIFRFDIHRFLNKASDNFQPFTTIDPITKQLVYTMLPKVYHFNIILKNSYRSTNNVLKCEYKKYRIIVNKEGILRVENLSEWP